MQACAFDIAQGDLAQFSRGVKIADHSGISRENLIRKKLVLYRLHSKSVLPTMKGAFGEDHDETNRE